MKIKLLAVGKTDANALSELIQKYESRLQHYLSFSMEFISDIKHSKKITNLLQKEKEGVLILQKLNPTDRVILLDKKGKEFDSMGFANFLQKQMNSGVKQLVFVVGGPYGFSEAVYRKAQSQISLSKMTFSHQMVRLFAVEQIYRGLSILENQPYHH